MSFIKEVIPQEDYRLQVVMDNGSSVVLNMKGRLECIRFGMLADEAFFSNVTTDGRYVRWDDKIEISLNEVFQLVQK